jgi:hypothetical protein
VRTYRFLVPPVDEEEEEAVHDEERVHDAEEVVRVPEGVEPGEPVQRRGEPRRDGGRAALGLALAERVRGQREGHGHQHHHGHAGDAHRAREQGRVRRLHGAERARHQRVLVRARPDHPREVARQVVPRVQRDPHHDRRRDHLHTHRKKHSINNHCKYSVLPDYDGESPPVTTPRTVTAGCACPAGVTRQSGGAGPTRQRTICRSDWTLLSSTNIHLSQLGGNGSYALAAHCFRLSNHSMEDRSKSTWERKLKGNMYLSLVCQVVL